MTLLRITGQIVLWLALGLVLLAVAVLKPLLSINDR